MEEQTAAGNPIPRESSICDECNLNPSKYRCPGCSIRSCSLPCVKVHKQRIGCTGKRPRTQFVPLSQFNDNLLVSDYNLLEEVKRVAESAQRMRHKLCGNSHFKLPFKLQNLRKVAGRRRTKILFLPSGMSKREKNQSRCDQRKKSIYWTIEWRFHSTDVVLIDHGVHENTSLCSVIENHLKPGPWNHQLRSFCKEHLDHLKFFIRIYPKGPRSPSRELDIKAPISEQLANIVIVEYPVIHVFLPSHSYDFEVVKDANPFPQKSKIREIVNTNYQSPKGVHFKEEEIEDDGICSDPRVLDLMKHVNRDPGFQIPDGALLHDRRAEKEVNLSSDMLLSAILAEGTNPVLNNELGTYSAEDNDTYSGFKANELEDAKYMGFDFEKDLRDAFSDLIAQVNPEDFLNLEGGFAEEGGIEERRDHSVSGVFSVEEVLEEGEIPWF
ncbi:hypothetical protein HHK36_011993 [Tetracentron sinense]|uniref:Box C/D snoRNA protein 1 n=1 Tax=Tetracentron sinense TaxID=13715 RepID=A0A834ZBX9_TETSI|nr:hypothetical protein HHK36_011993 [Tetracentron sinense]